MSKENLDQFIQQISDSEELQTRIGDEMDAETLIALGAEHGCDFTADDLTAGAELSDEELDGVAGGSGFLILGDKKMSQSPFPRIKILMGIQTRSPLDF